MGRTIAQDPLFFGAALAGGGALAEMARRRPSGQAGAHSRADGGAGEAA
jgi:hypothetical protein